MLGEQRAARKRLEAVDALVLFYLRVRLLMRAQVRSVGERAAAVLAKERLGTRVCPRMACLF